MSEAIEQEDYDNDRISRYHSMRGFAFWFDEKRILEVQVIL